MGNANRSGSATKRSHNRVAAILAHCTRYSFRGTSRLAADAGVSKSTVSHLVHGKFNPLYITVERVVKCLERALDLPLDLRDVVSESGCYPTKYVCGLVGCPRCLPETVYEGDGSRKAQLRNVRPGEWTGDVGEFDGDVTEMTE